MSTARTSRTFGLTSRSDRYFHVITNSIGLQNGQLSSDQLIRQLNVLNNAFNPINITFNLAGSNTFAPLHWYGGCGNDDEMERLWYKLHKGTYADLNVYSVPNILCVRTSGFFHRTQSWSISGYVHDFPTDVSPGALKESYDGVTISADTVPGGSLYRSNKGMTLVHEVGHWLGRAYPTFCSMTFQLTYYSKSSTPSRADAKAKAISSTTCRPSR
jgi:hypothetical protein